jgi:hypothetical protein
MFATLIIDVFHFCVGSTLIHSANIQMQEFGMRLEMFRWLQL